VCFRPRPCGFSCRDAIRSGQGALVPSPALYQRYSANILDPKSGYINALIRLRGGEADLPRFRADLARVSGRGDIDTWNEPEMARQFNRTLRFEATCLFAFGMAALFAALLLIGQAIARYTAASVEDLRTLRALGMTSRQSAVAAAPGPVVAAVFGASLGVGAAVFSSRWFPIGSASGFEPSPGIDIDWAVLATGLVLVPLVVLDRDADVRGLGPRQHRLRAALARWHDDDARRGNRTSPQREPSPVGPAEAAARDRRAHVAQGGEGQA